MPSLIKNRGRNSPGIITFTSGEAIWGLPRLSSRVQEFLDFQAKSGNWIFGVHVQGNFNYLNQWPIGGWLDFIMWPDPKAHFLSNVDPIKRMPLNCVNFMPAKLAAATSRARIWDICLISRNSTIKRIHDSLEIIRLLIKANSKLKVVLIVPDNRKIFDSHHSSDYEYFDLPKKIFSSNQLKNLTFISSSTESFGQYPLSDDFMSEIILQSKFVMLNSHSEGTPRSLAEALLLGTPIIVSENLKSGIDNKFNESNSVRISDDNLNASEQILEALNNYEKFRVDRQDSKSFFCESENLSKFKQFVCELYPKINDSDGRWHIEDLHLRLACHGQKMNHQFFNRSDLLFDWFGRVQTVCEDDKELSEDFLYGDDFDDHPSMANTIHRFFFLAISKLLRLLKAIRKKW